MTNRTINFALFAFALLLTIGSYILQYGFGLEPCSLCILDRILVILLSILFGLAWLHNPQQIGQWVYRGLGVLLAIGGILITLRHIWILHLPPEQMPDCIPSFNYLIQNLPLKDALVTMVHGSKECGKNPHAFLGLSLPGWTMVGFILIAVGCMVPRSNLNRK